MPAGTAGSSEVSSGEPAIAKIPRIRGLLASQETGHAIASATAAKDTNHVTSAAGLQDASTKITTAMTATSTNVARSWSAALAVNESHE